MLFEHLNVFLTPMYIRKPNTELFVGVHDLDGETTDTNNFFLMNKNYAVAFNIITNKIQNVIQNNNSVAYDNYDYTNAINKFAVNMKILNQDQYLTNYRGMGIKSNNMQQYEILRIVNNDLNSNLIYKNYSANTLLVKLQSKVDGTCLNSNIDHKLYFTTCDDYNLDQIFELRDNNINTNVSHFHIKNFSDNKYLSFSTTGAGVATAVERTVAHFFSYSSNTLQDINVTNVSNSNKILTNDNNNIKLISSDIGDKNNTMFTLTKQNLTTYKIIHNNSKTCIEYNPTALSYSLKPCETTDVQLFEIEEFNKNKSNRFDNTKNVSTGTFVMINNKYIKTNTNTGKLKLSSRKTNNTLKLDPQLQLNKVLYKNNKNEIVVDKSSNENSLKQNEVLGKVSLVKNKNDKQKTNLVIESTSNCITLNSKNILTVAPCSDHSQFQQFVIQDESINESNNYVANRNNEINIKKKRISKKNINENNSITTVTKEDLSLKQKQKNLANKANNIQNVIEVLSDIEKASENINLRITFKGTAFDKLSQEQLDRFKGRKIFEMSGSQILSLSDYKITKSDLDQIRDISRKTQRDIKFYHDQSPFYSNYCLLYGKDKMKYGEIEN